jgi:hypothetical protein
VYLPIFILLENCPDPRDHDAVKKKFVLIFSVVVDGWMRDQSSVQCEHAVKSFLGC